jgi:hypothetical protein
MISCQGQFCKRDRNSRQQPVHWRVTGERHLVPVEILQDRLYREYGRNCSDAGRPTIGKTAFGRAMKKLRPTAGDYQRTVNGVLT